MGINQFSIISIVFDTIHHYRANRVFPYNVYWWFVQLVSGFYIRIFGQKFYILGGRDCMLSESLIRSCLHNWLGYGNVNGEIWFIGTEEGGGAEIWRNETQTLESSLTIRSKFSIAMDFKYVWEDLYKVPLKSFRGASVWSYMAYLLLCMEGKPDSNLIRDYIFDLKKLGSFNSNHFMCELLPLPKRTKNSIEDYKSVWKSVDDYHREVIPRRFDLIRETITENNSVNIIVSYERLLTEQFLHYFKDKTEKVTAWEFKNQQYSLYKIRMANNRNIYLLSTPFFGNGRISYDGLKYASCKLLEVL
jgi:hypothetical protein